MQKSTTLLASFLAAIAVSLFAVDAQGQHHGGGHGGGGHGGGGHWGGGGHGGGVHWGGGGHGGGVHWGGGGHSGGVHWGGGHDDVIHHRGHHDTVHHDTGRHIVNRVYRNNYVTPTITYLYSRRYDPHHSYHVVRSGDRLDQMCMSEYGRSDLWKRVCDYNRLDHRSPLAIGQMIKFPTINRDGSLAHSSAPAPPNSDVYAEQVAPVPHSDDSHAHDSQAHNVTKLIVPVPPQPSLPQADIEVGVRPNVAVGSALTLSGQHLGDEQGEVRVHIGTMVLPVEVVAWSVNSTQVRLPIVQLTSATHADIEVVRADGSVSSKTHINLTPATQELILD